MILSFPARWASSTSRIPSPANSLAGWAKAHLRRAHHLRRGRDGGHAPLCPPYVSSVIANEAKQSIVRQGKCGLLRRFAPRNDGGWLFLFFLVLRGPLIRNAPDYSGIAELLPQIIHRAFGMGRA